MRINKYLTEVNFCSRRQADELIRRGKVKVGNKVAVLGQKIQNGDTVIVNGKKIVSSPAGKTYLLYNKPVGVECTTNKKIKNNIIDKIRYPERIYSVGRLDVKTSGLIILTNDGETVNKILKAQNRVEKEYEVETGRDILQSQVSRLTSGVRIGDEYTTRPARVEKLGKRKFSIVITEGKNRQIRKMCEAVGNSVIKLERVRIGDIQLKKLRIGEWRNLNEAEIVKLSSINHLVSKK